MNKLDLSIVIPTRNRSTMIIKTIKVPKNKFFFKEIIVVTLNKFHKLKIRKYKNINRIKVRFFNSKPSISLQRNIGLNKIIKKRKYVMFLDDDLNFEKNAFKKMYFFLKKNKNLSGVGFNLIIKKTNSFIEILKSF